MQDLRVIYTIWLREFRAFLRDGRILGMIGQPLLYLLILGQGIANGMTLNRAPGVSYLQFMFPGILGMSVLFTSMFSAMSIIWDREFGFLKEVLVAPVPRWAVAVGKVLGGATIAVFQSMIMVVLAPFAGIYPSPQMAVELLLLCFLIGVAMTSLGTAIAVRMRSMQSFQMIMNFLVMPLYFLSGAMFPLDSAPAWMQTLMVLDPLTYGVDALRHIVLSGVDTPAESARLAGLVRWDMLTDVSILGLSAVLLVGVATVQFNRTSLIGRRLRIHASVERSSSDHILEGSDVHPGHRRRPRPDGDPLAQGRAGRAGVRQVLPHGRGVRRKDDARTWDAAVRGEPVDWDRLFAGYRATVDVPSCLFYRELMEKYPEAKVILTVRDPERWYDSIAPDHLLRPQRVPEMGRRAQSPNARLPTDDRPALGPDVPGPVRGPGLCHRRLQPAQ